MVHNDAKLRNNLLVHQNLQILGDVQTDGSFILMGKVADELGEEEQVVEKLFWQLKSEYYCRRPIVRW